jgi:hypothetical protein
MVDVAPAPTVDDVEVAANVAVTVYPISGLPPLSAGATHETSSAPSRPRTVVICGAEGALAGRTTTGFDGPLAGLVPTSFVAVARTWYGTPAH